MRRVTAGAMWTLGMAVALLGLACGPSTPQPPAAETSAPQPTVNATPFVGAPLGVSPAPAATPGAATPSASPGTATAGTTTPSPSPATATSAPTSTLVATPTLWGVGPATAGPLLISAAEQPTGVQSLLWTEQQFGHSLRNLALDQPTGEQMVQVVQQAASIMAQLPGLIPQMSTFDRQQALFGEQEMSDGIFRVLSAYVYHTNPTGPTTAQGTPGLTPGVPLLVIGTPRPAGMVTPPPSTGQMLIHDVQQLILQAANLSKGHPDEGDLSGWLTSLEFRLAIIRQSVPLLSDEDLQTMTTGVAQAMNQFADAMNSYVNQ